MMKPGTYALLALLFTTIFITSAHSSTVKNYQYSSQPAAPAPIPQPTHMPPGRQPVPQTQPQNQRMAAESLNSPARGVVGDGWADVILGQPDFSQVTPNQVTANKLFNPGGVFVDRSVVPNRVYVFDAGNSRILGFSHLGTAKGGAHNGQPCTSDSDYAGSTCVISGNLNADIVLGQSSFSSSACNGDGGFQTYPNRPLPSNTTICGILPDQISILEGGSMATMAADTQGDFYFPDVFNNRVLRFNDPFKTDNKADFVWGQTSFSEAGCNQGASYGAPTDTSLCLAPPPGYGNIKSGVTVDAQGNLWVADTQNNRVLRFPYNATTGSPKKAADLVLGQPNFTSAAAGSALNQMSSPASIRIDSHGTLYVADGVDGDGSNGRVLLFKAPFSNGMSASQVLQSGMGEPSGIELDPAGGLWVNDCDHQALLHFVNGILQQTVSDIPGGIWGGLGIDRDNKILLTGWSAEQVQIYTPPDYAWTATFLQANEVSYGVGSFNQLGPRGINSPQGLEVAAGQLLVADGSRLLYWNIPWNLTSYQPADGVVGQPNFQTRPRWAPAFGRMRADNQGRLWVIKGDTYDAGTPAQIIAYNLPLQNGAAPARSLVSPLPLKGGGSFSWTWSVINGGMAYQPSCDCLWLSDRNDNRVFRIRSISTTPTVDIVLGQTSNAGIHCNQGRDSDDLYTAPVSPSRNSLCAPGALAFDGSGNLFLADNSLEFAGNLRMLEFDLKTLPDKPAAAVFGISASRVFGRNGSFTEPNCVAGDPMCGPWEPAFNSENQMVVGMNGYFGYPFPQIYQDPLNNPYPVAQLSDYFSHGYSARFDQFDNLYMIDEARSRVLIYKNQAVPVFPVSGAITAPVGSTALGVLVNVQRYPTAGVTDPSGSYTLNNLVPGTYTITPTKKDCTFTPPSRTLTITNSSAKPAFSMKCKTNNTYLPLFGY